ncbi:hypothetical protein BDQ94DRAFT_147014 [Aspergillus welwitschiae]|uniref:Uncharacterized protein n=1 Tax=Aspergillus welwitschiae TaxID=1341132 RepID=A0A3F3PXH0_9EURO|nr:hypothetical protein BDQ94DRAFT_147014 [Aspergillus welwitschiae]RDH31581.1 hypothetical protein BDQ94DRAFT_147014 [Aspergillus welwitschiae]
MTSIILSTHNPLHLLPPRFCKRSSQCLRMSLRNSQHVCTYTTGISWWLLLPTSPVNSQHQHKCASAAGDGRTGSSFFFSFFSASC